ncbi:MAG: DnaB-like helicase C-terminal domain-containing protein [Actinomycetes bacterium]
MPSIQLLLSDHDLLAMPAGPAVPTGFADLDDVVNGGLSPETLWAVTGPGGVGRSMFLTQLARQAAAAGVATLLINGRETVGFTVACLLAGQGRVPLHRLRAGRPGRADGERLAVAREQLMAFDLEIHAAGRTQNAPDLKGVLARSNLPRLLLVDDVDLCGQHVTGTLRQLRAVAAETGATVIVSSPSDVVLDGDRPRPAWGRLPHVLLALDRPEMWQRDSPRAGEIDLILLRNHAGPTARLGFAFQGHYARIDELPSASLQVAPPQTRGGER